MQPRDAFDVWVAHKAQLVIAEDAAECFEHYHQPGWTRQRALDNFARKIADRWYRDMLFGFGRQAPQRFDIDECSEAVEALIEECAKSVLG